MLRALGYLALAVAALAWGAVVLTVLLLVPLYLTGTVKAYTLPSSSMEPTLHCARPGPGCEGSHGDRFLVLTRFVRYERGDIVVFDVPPRAAETCGRGGKQVKRIVGLPGERVELRLVNGREHVFVDGLRLREPYVEDERRGLGPERSFDVEDGTYFVLGDNRGVSCDSRVWGPLPRGSVVGEVVLGYWPPDRIGFR